MWNCDLWKYLNTFGIVRTINKILLTLHPEDLGWPMLREKITSIMKPSVCLGMKWNRAHKWPAGIDRINVITDVEWRCSSSSLWICVLYCNKPDHPINCACIDVLCLSIPTLFALFSCRCKSYCAYNDAHRSRNEIPENLICLLCLRIRITDKWEPVYGKA